MLLTQLMQQMQTCSLQVVYMLDCHAVTESDIGSQRDDGFSRGRCIFESDMQVGELHAVVDYLMLLVCRFSALLSQVNELYTMHATDAR